MCLSLCACVCVCVCVQAVVCNRIQVVRLRPVCLSGHARVRRCDLQYQVIATGEDQSVRIARLALSMRRAASSTTATNLDFRAGFASGRIAVRHVFHTDNLNHTGWNFGKQWVSI